MEEQEEIEGLMFLLTRTLSSMGSKKAMVDLDPTSYDRIVKKLNEILAPVVMEFPFDIVESGIGENITVSLYGVNITFVKKEK